MSKVLVFYKLRKGVDHKAFEVWVREVDRPALESLTSAVEVRSYRVVGRTSGAPVAQYVDEIVVTSLNAFQKDMEAPYLKGVMQRWLQYVEEYSMTYCEDTG